MLQLLYFSQECEASSSSVYVDSQMQHRCRLKVKYFFLDVFLKRNALSKNKKLCNFTCVLVDLVRYSLSNCHHNNALVINSQIHANMSAVRHFVSSIPVNTFLFHVCSMERDQHHWKCLLMNLTFDQNFKFWSPQFKFSFHHRDTFSRVATIKILNKPKRHFYTTAPIPVSVLVCKYVIHLISSAQLKGSILIRFFFIMVMI